MAESDKKPDKIDDINSDAAAKAAPDSNPDPKAELPNVESPSISPADDVPSEKEPADRSDTALNALTIFNARAEQEAPKSGARFTISPRLRRSALLAASVAIAAALGAVIGSMAGGVAKSKTEQRADASGAEETQAMRKSIAHLTKEIATLKAGVETANRNATSQIGKIADRIATLDRAPETTGSINKTVAPAPVAPQAAIETPLPPVKPQIVKGWSVHEARNGMILVEGGGDLFEVAPGSPLPGLGRVESIKRDNGHIVVATSKGLIVSDPPQRAARIRSYYPPPFYRPY
jgi:hypothetical protein